MCPPVEIWKYHFHCGSYPLECLLPSRFRPYSKSGTKSRVITRFSNDPANSVVSQGNIIWAAWLLATFSHYVRVAAVGEKVALSWFANHCTKTEWEEHMEEDRKNVITKQETSQPTRGGGEKNLLLKRLQLLLVDMVWIYKIQHCIIILNHVLIEFTERSLYPDSYCYYDIKSHLPWQKFWPYHPPLVHINKHCLILSQVQTLTYALQTHI